MLPWFELSLNCFITLLMKRFGESDISYISRYKFYFFTKIMRYLVI